MARWIGIAALLAAMALGNIANAADKLVLQLHGPAQFEFAGYYAALWQGYYKKTGLDVDIRPGAAAGQTSIDSVREVSEGHAQFGTGDAGLVVRAGQGLPLLLLAPIFQASGAMIYYRPDSDFASPGALGKAKLGRLPASNILDIELATALRSEGLDPNKLAAVPLQSGQVLDALTDHRVDAIAGSAWDLPWLARARNLQLKATDPADYRVEFYGDTLFTRRELAQSQPDTVRRFRAASLEGWRYALDHPDEMAGLMLSQLPHPPGIADAGGFARYQAGVARRLARYPEVALGHSNPQRWTRIEASMIAAGALLHTADADEFVYDPDAAARRRTDLRSLTIIGATVLGGIAVLALLWMRRHRVLLAMAARGGRQEAATEPAAGSAFAPAPTPPLTAATTELRPLPAPVPPPATPAGTVPPLPTPAAATPPAPAAEPKPAAPVTAAAAAPPVPAPPPADLNDVLARLERRIRQRASRRIACRLSLLPTLWRCRADPQGLGRLVLDLVGEAAADLKGGSELIVGTRNFTYDAAAPSATPGARQGEWARITVRDNGPGLSDEALARVLEPANSKRPLAAAAAVALDKAGGFVRVESAEGVGTAVHLYFPRVAEAAAGKPAEQPAAAE